MRVDDVSYTAELLLTELDGRARMAALSYACWNDKMGATIATFPGATLRRGRGSSNGEQCYSERFTCPST